MPPEALTSQNYDIKVVVFSYGCIGTLTNKWPILNVNAHDLNSDFPVGYLNWRGDPISLL